MFQVIADCKYDLNQHKFLQFRKCYRGDSTASIAKLAIGKRWDIVTQGFYTNLFIKVVHPRGEAQKMQRQRLSRMDTNQEKKSRRTGKSAGTLSADSDDYFRSSRGAIVMPSGCTWYSRQNMSPSVLHAPGPAQEIRNERCTDPSQFTRLP